jgi:hypothetical protein
VNATLAEAVRGFVRSMREQMLRGAGGGGTRLGSWAAARWMDFVLAAQWLWDKAPNSDEQWLFTVSELAHDQGMDWKKWWGKGGEGGGGNDSTGFAATSPTGRRRCRRCSPTVGGGGGRADVGEGVNNAQAMKVGGVWFRQSRDPDDAALARDGWRALDTWHGTASGIFGCDEHLAGKMPSRGAEVLRAEGCASFLLVMHGRGGDVLTRVELRCYRRPRHGGGRGDPRVQRPARDDDGGHVGAPIPPAGQSGGGGGYTSEF